VLSRRRILLFAGAFCAVLGGCAIAVQWLRQPNSVALHNGILAPITDVVVEIEDEEYRAAEVGSGETFTVWTRRTSAVVRISYVDPRGERRRCTLDDFRPRDCGGSVHYMVPLPGGQHISKEYRRFF
jgi:hypothetical protein